MKESRRDFLKKSAMLAAGATTLPLFNLGCAATPKKENEVGVQLWSVREPLSQDFQGTINRIGEIGFDFVEAYGLNPTGEFEWDITAEGYRQAVESAGMRIASCHSSYFQAEETPQIIETVKKLNTNWVNIAWISEEVRSDYYAVAENLNAIGEQLKAEGIGFGYHNHDFEFFETENGEIGQEIMLNNTNPEYVSFQADLYWFIKAGVDPIAYINKYPGRFCSYHIKDANNDLDQTDIGTGIVDFESILALNEKAGIQYVFVEDERTDNPFQNVEIGLQYLKSLDF